MRRFRGSSWRRSAYFAVLLAGSAFAVEPPSGGDADGVEDRVDEKADAHLREMSDYLGGLPEFTVVASTSTEVVLESGQKLELDATSNVAVRRPDRLRSERSGEIARLSLFYDGRRLSLMGHQLNLYATAPAPATIDETIDFARDKLGLDVPGADLLRSDVHAVLTSDAVSGKYIGETIVDGVACHHLAFRGEEVDWQLWIEAGPRPLPRKYVITSKDVVGEPEFTVTLRDWNLDPELTEETFRFEPPPDAEEIEFLGLQKRQEQREPGQKGDER